MIRRILAGSVLMYMIVVTVLPFTFKGIIDDGAVRYKPDGDIFYFDFDVIPASNTSDEDAALRSMAIKANNMLNEEREKEGLDVLDWDNDLEVISSVRAKECEKKFSHTRPSGEQWYTVNSKIQGGENLAFGFDNAEDAVEAWMNSTTHRENILYDDFTKGAISIYEADDGTYYWANEFSY